MNPLSGSEDIHHIAGEILDSMPEAVLSFSLTESRLVYASPPVERVLGRPIQDFSEAADLFERLIHPDDLDLTREARDRALREGSAEVEHRLIWPDGQVRWLDQRVWVNRDRHGRPCRMNVVLRDITEAKCRDTALRQSTSLLHRFMDHFSSGVFIQDLDGRLHYSNALNARSFHMSPDEIVGKLPEEYAAPEQVPLIRGENRRLLESGEDRLEFEYHGERNGKLLHWRIVKFLIPQADGQPLIGGIAISTTRDKETEIALQTINEELEQRVADRTAELGRAKDRLQAIFDHSGDAILLLDMSKGIQQANHAFDALFNVSSQDYLGKRLRTFFHPDDQDAIGRALAQVSTSHETHHIDCRAAGEGGCYFDVEISIAPVNRSDEAVRSLVCIVRNVRDRKQAERALRRSEERLNMMMIGTRAGTWEWLVQTGETVVNARWAEIVGCTLEDLAPTSIETWVRLAHPDDLTRSNRLLEEHFSGKTPFYDCELRLRHKEGHWVWVWDRGMVIEWTPDGKPLRMLGTQVDITDMKRAQRAVAEERNLLRTVIDTVPDYIYVKDREHRFSLCNTAYALVHGYADPAELNGKSDSDLFPPETCARFRKQDEQVLGMSAFLSDLESDLTHVSGKHVWTLTSKVPLHNLEGDLTGVLCVTHDVTAIKQQEEALRESEQRYRLLAERIKDVIIRQRLDSIITFVTPSCYSLAGYAPEELVGTSGMALVHPDDQPASIRIGREAAESGATFFSIEERIRHKDGRYIWIDITYTIVRDPLSGAPIELIGIMHDITERQAAEAAMKQALAQERELGALKTRFVSMASHEFRTPLAAILATTETLMSYRDRLDSAQIDVRLDKIRRQVNYMKGIMDEVLELARMQAGRVDFRPQTGDVDLLCQDIIEEFDGQNLHYGRIRFDCPHPPVSAWFDERLMRQIISNLISNSLKYSPPAKPVDVQLTHDEDEITLRVQDAGIGIPEGDLRHLFEPFHRATNVGVISGTGLGLSITKQAVELHQGVIVTESFVNKGTTFTVRIPKRTVKAEPD